MTISIRVNGGEPIMVTDNTAAQLRVHTAMSQTLMPKTPSTTAVHMLMLLIARAIEEAEVKADNVVPLHVVTRV